MRPENDPVGDDPGILYPEGHMPAPAGRPRAQRRRVLRAGSLGLGLLTAASWAALVGGAVWVVLPLQAQGEAQRAQLAEARASLAVLQARIEAERAHPEHAARAAGPMPAGALEAARGDADDTALEPRQAPAGAAGAGRPRPEAEARAQQLAEALHAALAADVDGGVVRIEVRDTRVEVALAADALFAAGAWRAPGRALMARTVAALRAAGSGRAVDKMHVRVGWAGAVADGQGGDAQQAHGRAAGRSTRAARRARGAAQGGATCVASLLQMLATMDAGGAAADGDPGWDLGLRYGGVPPCTVLLAVEAASAASAATELSGQ